jgi:uncharacterized protein
MNNQTIKFNLLKRFIVLVIGLMIMALGVSFSLKASLGTSPISSVAYVISLFCPLSVGTATICLHCIFIALQILILRKNYKLVQLLQLPMAFIFGYLTDFSIWVIKGINYSSYWQQWILCIVGILLVAIGVSLEVYANIVPLAGEGLILAICKVTPIKFAYMKVIFDVSLVVIACILSFIFMNDIYGVREGTVAAAIFVGLVVKQINKYWGGRHGK